MRALVPSRPPSMLARRQYAAARVARQAAAQLSTQPPSSIVGGTGFMATGTVGPDDRQYATRYQQWQIWARRYARTVDAARFAAGVTADSCARCELRIERREGRKWVEADNPNEQRLIDALDEYSNGLQESTELIRLHAWHYQVAGECAQVIRDSSDGLDWGIYSVAAISFGQPDPATATVRLLPSGTVRNGGAFEVPRSQIFRFWIPDEEWQAYATSPMVASIDALHRYWGLARMAKRTTDSRLLQNGIFWTPGEAHEALPTEEMEGGGSDLDNPVSPLDQAFYDAARRAYNDDDDIASVAPFSMHWDKDWGPPQHIEIGRGLDPHGIEYRDEARQDFARGVNMPGSWLESGGPGAANHWGDWMADEKFINSAVVPTMDRITHGDITASFLFAACRSLNMDPEAYRVGFDTSTAIIKPDQSELALKLYMAGLLKGDRALEAARFDPVEDRMDDAEFAKLVDLTSKGRAEATVPGQAPAIQLVSSTDQAPIGPANVTKAAPAAPRAAALGTTVSKAQTALAKLTTIRQRLGRRLLDAAEVAFEDAVRRAGGKVQQRAKRGNGSLSKSMQAAVAAVDAGEPLGVHLAAVGITEEEMLYRAFESYEGTARRWMTQASQQQRQAIEAAGLDPDDYLPDDDERVDSAVGALVAGLLALARQRLTQGVLTPAKGEVSGVVPARYITGPLSVLTGRVAVTHGRTPDAGPSLHPSGQPSLEEAVAAELQTDEEQTQYVWRWGYYGDPITPFEPHQDLGFSDFTTSDPTGDPDLANAGEEWLDGDLYQPNDHDGCTCEWEPVIEGGPGVGATIGRFAESSA